VSRSILARQLLAATPYMRDRRQLIPVLHALVGTSISVQAIKVDLLGNHRKPTDHIVLSERAVRRAEQLVKRREKIATLDVGQICQGIVTSITKFGAITDLGEGARGLIHISELSSSNVERVEDVLQVGDEIQVYVLTLDREENRIGLSLRRLDSVATSERI
jgi:small subunit ribosomal protein S1